MVQEVPDNKQKFAMGITSAADAIGVCIARLIAIPAHNAICMISNPIWKQFAIHLGLQICFIL